MSLAPGSLSRLGISVPTLIGMSAVPMWSATVALYRGVAEAFGPIGGAAIIFTLASCFAWAGAIRQGVARLPLRYLVLGGTMFVTYEIALALAVGFTTSRAQAMEVGMINYLWPSLTVALAIAMRQERADWRMVPGLGLSLAGVIWVASGETGLSIPRLIDNVGTHPLPYGLAALAALTWPIYTMLTRLHSDGRNGVPLFLSVTAVALWACHATSDEPALAYDHRGAVMALSFGLLTTMAYSAWNHGVMQGNLTIMAATSYFAPVLSVVTSSLIFGLVPTPGFWMGALLVTGGSLLCWVSTMGRRTA